MLYVYIDIYIYTRPCTCNLHAGWSQSCPVLFEFSSPCRVKETEAAGETVPFEDFKQPGMATAIDSHTALSIWFPNVYPGYCRRIFAFQRMCLNPGKPLVTGGLASESGDLTLDTGGCQPPEIIKNYQYVFFSKIQ